jgi:mono/diheme cytochrome c family protein
MKRIIALLALLSLTIPAHAAAPRVCRNTTAARVNRVRFVSTAHSNNHAAQQQFVITAFAVPVAVPVAPFATYWYGVSDYHVSQALPDIASFPLSARSKGKDLPRETASDVGSQSEALRDSPAPRSLIAQHCTSCHGRTSPKQGLSLVDPLSLSDQDRLKSIRAVINGEMPPADAEPLSEADRSAILRELLNESPTAKNENDQ